MILFSLRYEDKHTNVQLMGSKKSLLLHANNLVTTIIFPLLSPNYKCPKVCSYFGGFKVSMNDFNPKSLHAN
jgi:hypothetical protein